MIGIGLNTGINSGDLVRGLIAYYPMKAITGSVVSDYSTQANHCSFTGSFTPIIWPAWNSSSINRTGGGLYFSGSSLAAAPAVTTTITNNFTITAWYYPKSTATGATQEVLYNGNDSTAGYYMRWRDSQMFFAIAGITAGTGVNGVVVNAWNFCVLSRQSGTNWMNLNGVWTNTGTTTPNVPVGKFAIGNGFYGYIDEIRFYNRMLTDAEVLWLYRNPSSPSGVK